VLYVADWIPYPYPNVAEVTPGSFIPDQVQGRKKFWPAAVLRLEGNNAAMPAHAVNMKIVFSRGSIPTLAC
jgi:hypothetical protein